ncbi:MAG: TonB family protein [Sphingobacteriales bacterium]|nr:MAG: TonB family protein [Sphingobacteriales bacterium]
MLYLIQVVVYTALFLLVYLLFLRNKPLYSFNRVYLLVAAISPVILPFIKLPGIERQMQAVAITSVQLPEFTIAAGQQQAVNTGISLFWVIYAGISVTIAIVAMWRWNQLRKFIARQSAQQQDGYVLLTNTGYGPGSWHKYIILPDETINETVVGHELAHIRLHHTRDALLMTILQICFWPNIFLIWLKKELTQVHEFQADASVATDERAYAELLLSNMFHTCTLPQTHSFIIHPIKRRIMMLKKQNGGTKRVLTLSITACAVGLLLSNIVVLQSCKGKSWTVKEQEVAKQQGEAIPKTEVSPDSKEIMPFAEKMPEFPGGQNGLVNFLTHNIKYPDDAKKRNVEGKVFVQFVVDKDGSIILPVIKKSPDTLLSTEALRMISKMPRWTPGEEKGEKVMVKYTLPIYFKLA